MEKEDALFRIQLVWLPLCTMKYLALMISNRRLKKQVEALRLEA
jgi:hypothetical protein